MLIKNAPKAFGAGLTGVCIVHVTCVSEFSATVTGAEEAPKFQGGFPGFVNAFGIGFCFPLAERPPMQVRYLRLPNDDTDVKGPAFGRFFAVKKVV